MIPSLILHGYQARYAGFDKMICYFHIIHVVNYECGCDVDKIQLGSLAGNVCLGRASVTLTVQLID